VYEVKKRIFLDLTKSQKSALCNHLRALVKAVNVEADNLLQKFLDDEKYYLEINSSRFEFLKDLIEDEKFLKEALLYLKECKKHYDYKKAQEPLRQAQKEFDKKKRKFLQEIKMSKEKPTKKQLSYYKSLCKKYNIDKQETEELSKLDLKKMIEEIVNEYKRD